MKDANLSQVDLTQLDLLISADEITTRLEEIGEILNREYKGKELTLVMIMKGAICLAADLIRRLQMPHSVEFIQCQSYGMRGTSPGDLKITGLDSLDLKEKEVLLIDDIYDSGNTLSRAYAELKEKKPVSLKSLVLLSKNVPHQADYLPDHVLFEIEDRFVIGYGLDYKEYYRGLPAIYAIAT